MNTKAKQNNPTFLVQTISDVNNPFTYIVQAYDADHNLLEAYRKNDLEIVYPKPFFTERARIRPDLLPVPMTHYQKNILG